MKILKNIRPIIERELNTVISKRGQKKLKPDNSYVSEGDLYMDKLVADFVKDNYSSVQLVSEESSKIYTVYVPGIIAFLFYTKSILFLFFGIFILCIFCSLIEFISFKFSHRNVIFSYVIGNVLAYRMAHFGYMPQNTYKLIIAIFVTIGVINLILSIINTLWKK